MTNFLRGCRLLWLAVTTGGLIAATTAWPGKASGITTDQSGSSSSITALGMRLKTMLGRQR